MFLLFQCVSGEAILSQSKSFCFIDPSNESRNDQFPQKSHKSIWAAFSFQGLSRKRWLTNVEIDMPTFFLANNIFCHIHENQCVQGCCSHTLWQYSSNLQRKSNFENGSQIKGRDGETNYAQGLYVFFCRILKAGWLPAGKLIKRKVASSQVRNANPRCWHVAKKEDGCP